MLHMLLLILKILGIVLLVILGLVLFIVLTLLLVPVRYRIAGQKDADLPKAEAVVSWMLGMFRVKIDYHDKKVNTEIRIIGISLTTIKGFVGKIKHRIKKTKKKKEPELLKSTGNQDKVLTDISEKKTEESVEDSPKETVSLRIKIFNILKKIGDIIRKILAIPGKVLNTLKKITLTIQNICDKIRYWKNFVTEETTKEALSYVKVISGRLLRHLLPKKVKGYIRFGFDDPAKTGQILGAVSMITPIYRSKFCVFPVFEEKVFECDIAIKGRLYGCVLVKAAFDIYRNRAVKTTIKKFQHKEA